MEREPAPLPSQSQAANELTVAIPSQIDWQLPAVVPVLATGCELPVFEPQVGPSVQIAFCVWRN